MASSGNQPLHFTVQVQGFVQKRHIPRLYYAKLEVGSQVRWTKVRRATRAGGAAEIFNFYATNSEEMLVRIYQRYRLPFHPDRLVSVGSMTIQSLLHKTPEQNRDNNDFAKIQDVKAGDLKAKRLVTASGIGIITLWITATATDTRAVSDTAQVPQSAAAGMDGLPQAQAAGAPEVMGVAPPQHTAPDTVNGSGLSGGWSEGSRTLSGTIWDLDIASIERVWSANGQDSNPRHGSTSGKRSSWRLSKSENGNAEPTTTGNSADIHSPRPSAGVGSKRLSSKMAHVGVREPDKATEQLIENLKALSEFVDNSKLSSHSRAGTDASNRTVVADMALGGPSGVKYGSSLTGSDTNKGVLLFNELVALAMEIALFVKDEDQKRGRRLSSSSKAYPTADGPREMQKITSRYTDITNMILQTLARIQGGVVDDVQNDTLNRMWQQWVVEFDLPSAPFLLLAEPPSDVEPISTTEHAPGSSGQATGIPASTAPTMQPPASTPSPFSTQPSARSLQAFSDLKLWSNSQVSMIWGERQLALLTSNNAVENTRLAWTLLLDLRRRGYLVVGLSCAKEYLGLHWAAYQNGDRNSTPLEGLPDASQTPLRDESSLPPVTEKPSGAQLADGQPQATNSSVGPQIDPAPTARILDHRPKHTVHEMINTLCLGLASQDSAFNSELWSIMAESRSSRTCRDPRTQLDNLIFKPIQSRPKRLEEMRRMRTRRFEFEEPGYGYGGVNALKGDLGQQLPDLTLEARMSTPVVIILDGLEDFQDWVPMQIFLQTLVTKVIQVPQVRVLFTATKDSQLEKMLQLLNVERIDASVDADANAGALSPE